MTRTITALALLTAGLVAGAAIPRASADSGLGEVTRQLQGIHQELSNVRRVLETMARKP